MNIDEYMMNHVQFLRLDFISKLLMKKITNPGQDIAIESNNVYVGFVSSKTKRLFGSTTGDSKSQQISFQTHNFHVISSLKTQNSRRIHKNYQQHP